MKLELLGNQTYGAWFTDTENINKNSIIYSFGAGIDISWDLELIRRFGCKVYVFDPDPMAIDYIKTLSLPTELKFIPIGLGTHDGYQLFYNALKANKVNKSTIKKSNIFSQLPVKRLQTFMKDMGHDHIDILKMDIEGSEFAVIPTITHLPINQILVEIHTSFYRYGMKGLRRVFGWLQTKRVMWALKLKGFKYVYIRNEDYTFIKS